MNEEKEEIELTKQNCCVDHIIYVPTKFIKSNNTEDNINQEIVSLLNVIPNTGYNDKY